MNKAFIATALVALASIAGCDSSRVEPDAPASANPGAADPTPQDPPSDGTAESAALGSKKDRISYTIGVQIARSFKEQGIEIDQASLVRALQEILNGDKPTLEDKEMKQIMADFRSEMIAKQRGALKEPAEKSPKEKERLGYAIGVQIARGFKDQEIEVAQATLVRGIRDILTRGKAALSDEEMRQIMSDFRKEQFTKLAQKGLKEGEAFLTENAKNDGVIVLKSGLQYKVIKEGTGATPKASDSVKTHYKGTLINGDEFDSSYKRGEPLVFSVTGVIPGWTEALQLMKEGAKWQLFIPANLAYGERGSPPVIPPNAALIFEIELIEVVK